MANVEISIKGTDGASSAFKSVSKGLDDIKKSAEDATGHLSNAGSGLGDLGGHAGDAEGHLSLFHAGLELAVEGIVKLGEVLMDAVGAASHFQTKLTEIQNNTTMTNEDVATMSEGVKKLASESNVPLDKLADGFMKVTNFGFSAKDSTAILEQAMKSASSTGGDTAKTAELLASDMHMFGIKSEDAAKAMDILHLASAEGNTTLEQFTNASGKAYAMSAQLGVSFQDTSASLSAMTRQGVNANEATTRFDSILSKLIHPSKGAQKAIAELSKTTGVDLVTDFSEAGIKSKGFTQILEDVKKATGGNAEEMMKLFPEIRAFQGAMALTTTGAKDYKDILGQLNDVMEGKLSPTEDAFARSQNTLDFQIGKLKNNFDLLLIKVGDVFLPILTKGAGIVNDFIQAVVNGGVGIGDFGSIIGRVGSILADLGAFVMGAAQSLANALAPAVAQAGVILNQLLTIVGQVFGQIQTFIATNGPAIAQTFADIWNTVVGVVTGVLSTVLTVVSTVLGAISGFIATHGAEIQAFFSQAWSGIQTIIETILAAIQGTIIPILGAISAFISSHGAEIQAIIGAAWTVVSTIVLDAITVVKTIVTTVFEAVKTFLTEHGEQIKQIASAAWNFISTTVSTVIATVKTTVETISNGIQSFWSGHGEQIKTIASNAWQFISSTVSTLITAVKTTIETIANGIQAFWTQHGEQIKTIATAAWQIVSTVISGLINTIKTTVETVANSLQSFWTQHGEQIKSIATTAWNAVSAVIGTVVSAISGIISTFISVISGLWTQFGSQILSTITAAWNAVSTTISAAISAITTIIGGFIDLITGNWTRLGDTLNTAWTGMWNTMTTAVGTAVTGITDVAKGIIDWFTALPGKIVQAVSGLGGQLLTAGGEAIAGFIRGFSNVHIPMPHFNITMGSGPLGIPVPNVDVQWYAKGGVFNGPQVIGVGEAGPEAVLPVDRVAPMIAEAVRMALWANPNGAGAGGTTTNNNNSTDASDQRTVYNQNFYLTANYPQQSQGSLMEDVKRMQMLGART